MDTISRNLLNALIIILILAIPDASYGWGFHAHKKINQIAVFTLPAEMLVFYKAHVGTITENAVKPDMRRYAIKEEAPRHYIDIDVYGDSAIYTMPRYWEEAVKKYTEDTLMTYGIVPWHINYMAHALTKAFREKRVKDIIKLSSEIGHYIADANVPLHTTENYNGQLTDQHGIHGLWESRLPELFSNDYNLFTGRAVYLENTQLSAWDAVFNAHMALDSVLSFEKQVDEEIPDAKSYSYEEKGRGTAKVYSRKYSESFHMMLNGQVERQMRSSIKMVGDFWYTCWVNAGQPILENLLDSKVTDEERLALEEELKKWENGRIKSRAHEGQPF